MTIDIEVYPLTPGWAADYLAFFDHESGPAVSDNPEWSTCHCQSYHTPKAIDWKAREATTPGSSVPRTSSALSASSPNA